MSLTGLDIAVIVVFLLLIIGVGISYAKKAGKNIESFFLGGRNLPWWIAGTSMVATTFAADTPLAVTELVAQKGIAGNWLWWGFLSGGMLTTFFFAKYWRRSGVMTDVELIDLRYSGKAAHFLRGFRAIYLGLFINCLIIGWVNLALSSLLEVFFKIPPSEGLWYVGAAMAFVMVYSSFSGLKGIAVTDTIQFLIAMAGCILLAVFVLNAEAVGGISGLKKQLPSGTFNFFPVINSNLGGVFSISIGSFLAFIGMQWWASWYPGAEPGGGGYVVQRLASTKNEKHALYSSLFFQIAHYCLRPWPWIIVGLCCLVLYPDLAEGEQKLGYVRAMKDFLPSGLRGLLLVAFFAAYMSTLSTQLNWGASYLVGDFYKTFIVKNKKNVPAKEVLISRLGTILIALLSLLATTQMKTISGVWNFIIECGAGLGLVLILRWYWWRINVWSEIIATLAPFLGYLFTKYYLAKSIDPSWGQPIMDNPKSFLFIVSFTTVSWLLITFLTAPTSKEKLIQFYKKVSPDGFWSPVIKEIGSKKTSSSHFITLVICWLSSIVMAYSFLFLIGKSLLQEWKDAWICLMVFSGSLVLLVYLSRKISILK